MLYVMLLIHINNIRKQVKSVEQKDWRMMIFALIMATRLNAFATTNEILSIASTAVYTLPAHYEESRKWNSGNFPLRALMAFEAFAGGLLYVHFGLNSK